MITAFRRISLSADVDGDGWKDERSSDEGR